MTKAGSSIRQSTGLQNRRLQVRFLSRLPVLNWAIELVKRFFSAVYRGVRRDPRKKCERVVGVVTQQKVNVLFESVVDIFASGIVEGLM